MVCAVARLLWSRIEALLSFYIGTALYFLSLAILTFLKCRKYQSPKARNDKVDSFIASLRASNHPKVIIVGPYGSGKCTLMKRLGELYSLPCIDSDQIYGEGLYLKKEGKIEMKAKAWMVNEMQRRMKRYEGSSQGWVMKLNYFFAMPHVLKDATHLIWINYPWPVMLQRMVMRHYMRCIRQFWCLSKTKDEIDPRFMKETFTQAFGLWNVFDTHHESYVFQQLLVLLKYRREMEYRYEAECHAKCAMLELRDPDDGDTLAEW